MLDDRAVNDELVGLWGHAGSKGLQYTVLSIADPYQSTEAAAVFWGEGERSCIKDKQHITLG